MRWQGRTTRGYSVRDPALGIRDPVGPERGWCATRPRGRARSTSGRTSVAALVLAAGAALGADAASAQEPLETITGGTVEVRIAAIDLHAIDRTGSALTALEADQVEIEVDGRRAVIDAIEIATWSSERPLDAATPILQPLPDPPPPKTLIFFVQASLEPLRLRGQRAVLANMEELLAALLPGDRAAVFAFGSHLDLEQDLTGDRATLASALRRASRLEKARAAPRDRRGWLTRRLDRAAMDDVVSPEQALELIALALTDRGEEVVFVMLGWGLGIHGSDGVRMTPSWPRARDALLRIGASLLVVDVSDADWHSLEVGLQAGARETGGAYLRAKDFPRGVVKRLAAALTTRIRVWVRVPAATADDAPVRVELDGRVGTLLTAPRRLGARGE